jgi:hypothetical protein
LDQARFGASPKWEAAPIRQPTRSAVAGATFPFVTIVAYMRIERTAIFLKEVQIDNLQRLSNKIGAPVVEVILRAIDGYQSA